VKLKDAVKVCSAMGASLRKRDGEYRVAPKVGGKFTKQRAEEMAYFTNDLGDAVNTCRFAAERGHFNGHKRRKARR
jgi:hypothetical protein